MNRFRLFVLAVAFAMMSSVAAFAQRAAYLTQPLADSAWDVAQWISAVDAPVVTGRVEDGTRAADGASWFVAEVKNTKRVVAARWMTTGLGVYDLYINGQLVGDEVLKPGFTHYEKTRRAFTYDVTAAFNTRRGARNVLSAQVTPGWWADKIITPAGHDGMIGKKCAFRAVLELTFADGTTQLVGTDTDHWRAGIAGPVKHAAIFDGEIYDARELPGFADLQRLSKPEVNCEFQGEILPTAGAEVYRREDLALAPREMYCWQGVEGASDAAYGKVKVTRRLKTDESVLLKAGETLVVDFGQNCAGVPEFVFQAKDGTTLRCEFAELLNDRDGLKARGMDGPEGSVHRQNLRIPDTGMYLSYTFADTPTAVTYSPRTTFFGYRYASITVTDDVTIERLRTIPVTSIAAGLETGRLTTGNDLINRLVSNTVWGQRSNYLSVPTDCPQRNERLGWTADTQVFAATGTYFANTRDFFHKWMRDMRDTQSPQGGFPGVAPQAQYGASEVDMMRVGWADAGVIVPWTVWRQFGDKAIVDENWAAMERFVDHINATKYDHAALKTENGNYQWADWLSYEALESCTGKAWDANGVLPDASEYWSYLCASYWAIDAAMMRDMAEATGRDAAKYEAMTVAARAYLQERFLNADGTFKVAVLNTMQTPALFALKNHLVTGAAKLATIARLRENFAQHGNCLQTGFLGTSILLPTLTDNGMADIAYELLFQRRNPSWLYSVDNGATTIWERWNSYMIDEGMGPQGMNSFNHYAYGVVCQWLWETAAGIAADSRVPGFRHIIMRPVPDRRLGHLEAEYQSAAGLVKSAWHYDADRWVWRFTIPEGATASVTLPGESVAREYAAGDYCVECPVWEGRNPIVPGWYADPEGAYFEDQYWVYPTLSLLYGDDLVTYADDLHRTTDAINPDYNIQTHMDAFSSPDLVTWTKHPAVLSIKDVPWVKYALWAPSVVHANGRYYIFFGGNDIQREGEVGGIGVAVSDRPEGPFRDALGRPLIDRIVNGAQPIDQFVFRDDDGFYYMYYGGWRHCNMVRLAPDLLSVVPFDDGTIYREVTPENYVEGPFMMKRGGKYYFMWSEGGWMGPDYSVAYAIADSPFGPFKRIGKILQQDPAIATGAGHHSVIQDPRTGECYIVYHRRPLTTDHASQRETCIDRLLFDDDGYILPVRMTK